MTSAVVFDIQRTSLQDGPGIRTTVFLKGCSMRCGWCHNPESFERAPASVVLPSGKLKTYGTVMTDEEVFESVAKDKPYYDASGGGVTVSGGEPLLFPAFVAGLFGRCATAGIATAVETNGLAPWAVFQTITPVTDLFLFDYKATPSALHERLTGAPLEPVLANLERLANAGKAIVLRCPIVPDVNDTDEHLRAIAELCIRYGIDVNAMPYHATAIDKWRGLGLPYAYEGKPTMDHDATENVLARIAAFGCPRERLSAP